MNNPPINNPPVDSPPEHNPPANSTVDYVNGNPLKKIKKNVYIDGRRTSMSFEGYIWEQLERLGHEENLTVDQLCSEIERSRPDHLNISSVIRYLVLKICDMRDGAAASMTCEMNETAPAFPSALHTVLAAINLHAEDIAMSPQPHNGDTRQDNSKMSS